jgi:hypothetical protein
MVFGEYTKDSITGVPWLMGGTPPQAPPGDPPNPGTMKPKYPQDPPPGTPADGDDEDAAS